MTPAGAADAQQGYRCAVGVFSNHSESFHIDVIQTAGGVAMPSWSGSDFLSYSPPHPSPLPPGEREKSGVSDWRRSVRPALERKLRCMGRAERGRILDLVGGLVQNSARKKMCVGKAKRGGRVFRMFRRSTSRLHCSKIKCYDSASDFWRARSMLARDVTLNGPLQGLTPR